MSDKETEELRQSMLSDHGGLDLDEFGPGTFGYHEALHAASLITGLIDEQLMGHPSVARDKALFAKANDAFHAVFDLYQAMGKAESEVQK